MADAIHVHIDLDDRQYEAARYTFQVLLATATVPVTFHRDRPSDLSSDSVLITYTRSRIAPTCRRHLVIYASTRLWDRYGTEASLPSLPLARISLASLAAPPGARLADPLILPYVAETASPGAELSREPHPGCDLAVVTGADLIASAFFWITRYEETLIRERDDVGRVPQERLSAIVERIAERPLVDEYAELLMTWVTMLRSDVDSSRPPFRVTLTHDVDTGIGVTGLWNHVDNGLRALYRDARGQRRPLTGVLGLLHWLRRGLGFRAEAALFRDIVRLDAEFGFRSLFFLMANGTHPRDATYDISSDAAHRAIQAIRDAGGAIGLHVGLNAHSCRAQLRSEWEQLRHAEPAASPVARSHYLAFSAPGTWRELHDAGFTVDSTLGFSHHIGFRAGTCRAFRPFDIERREVLPIWELPMAIMDVSLFHERARDGARIEAASRLAARVRNHGGCLVVNWHNVSYLGHYRTVYLAILAEVKGAQPLSPDSLPAADGAVIW